MRLEQQMRYAKQKIEEKCRGEVIVDVNQEHRAIVMSVTKYGLRYMDSVSIDKFYEQTEKAVNNFIATYIAFIITKFIKANIEIELDSSGAPSVRIDLSNVDK